MYIVECLCKSDLFVDTLRNKVRNSKGTKGHNTKEKVPTCNSRVVTNYLSFFSPRVTCNSTNNLIKTSDSGFRSVLKPNEFSDLSFYHNLFPLQNNAISFSYDCKVVHVYAVPTTHTHVLYSLQIIAMGYVIFKHIMTVIMLLPRQL